MNYNYLWYVITMAEQQEILSDCEILADIKFLNVEKVSGVKIHRQLCAVYSRHKVMLKWHVYKWITRFDEGWNNIHDEPQGGQLSNGVNDKTIACVRALVNADHCLSVSDIFQAMVTSYLYISLLTGCS